MKQLLSKDTEWELPVDVSRSDNNLQIFLAHSNATTKATRSQTHYDNEPSVLVCVAGQKTIWLAPPGTETIENLPYWVENNGEENTEFLEYNPSIDMYRSTRWQRVDLGPGETLFLPAKWWHDVYSTSDSVGVSINLMTRRSTDKQLKMRRVVKMVMMAVAKVKSKEERRRQE